MGDSFFVSVKHTILVFLGSRLPDWAMVLSSMLIKIIGIAILASFLMMYITLIERKIIGRMQNRPGPNRVGKWGLLQPLADGIKMITKEDIVPDQADRAVHFLAPILIIIPALLVFSVIPFGRHMIAADLNVGLLFFLAISSTTTIAIFMASWGSRNKFSLLGGMRSAAQIISYEVPLVLSAVPVILMTGSLSTTAIVEAQSGWHGLKWFIFSPWGLVAFVIFFLCGVAECNRSPFDLAEGESEIVAGFHTEYSGMKFALFYMAEFMNSFTISALAATLFLGGWQGPFLPSWLWFFLKTFVLIFIMIWFRGTLPRIRVDQLMGLAWKFSLPLTLVNIFVAGFWYYTNLPIKIIGSLLILGFTFWILTKLNKTYIPEKRTYVFAD
jgi:NADH-quinone oxidoreductase subunit H